MLERHVAKYEALLPGAKPLGYYKGSPYFPRAALSHLHTPGANPDIQPFLKAEYPSSRTGLIPPANLDSCAPWCMYRPVTLTNPLHLGDSWHSWAHSMQRYNDFIYAK